MPGFSVPYKDSSFGGHGKSVDSNRTEYYYSYTWQIFQLVPQLTGHTEQTDMALINVRDVSLPTFTANQDTYTGSSLEYKWAKSVTWDDIKISWYDTVGLAEVMGKWRDSVWNPANGLQVASEYKKRSQIDVYLPTGYDVITWCLIGSWPKVIRQGELTYTNSDAKLVEVTVAYDWAENTSSGDDIDSVQYGCGYESRY